MKPSLDWSDTVEVSLWLDGLRSSFADLDAAASDMLKPARKRQLGPALHAKNYAAARAQIRTALAYAAPDTTPDPELSDPAGCGGAGPVL
jgi:hypothetical protein